MMEVKKVIYVGVILVFAIFAISIVSARHAGWHFWGAEPQQAPFDATVTVSNAPPVIITPLPDVIDNDNDITPGTPNDINPIGAGVNNAEIRFVVQDPNGIADLPGGGTSTESIILATTVGAVAASTLPTDPNLEVHVRGPVFAIDIFAPSCSELVACPDCGALVNVREYSCTVPIDYFREPGLYTLTVAIADPNPTLAFDSDSSKTFTLNSVTSFEITSPLTGIRWTGLSVSSPDTVVDAPLGLTNRGNVGITSGSIQASDLTPDPSGTSNLPANSFSVSQATDLVGIPDECCTLNNVDVSCTSTTDTADELSNLAVTIGAAGAPALPPSLPFGDGSGGVPPVDNELLHFCVWEQLDAHVPTLTLDAASGYSSTSTKGVVAGVAGNAWALLLS